MQVVIYLSRFTAILVLLIALSFRFSHAGRVCSGDYLVASDPPEGYLIEQGFFLKLHAFLLIAMAISLIVCGCFEACVTGDRNYRTDFR